MGSGSSKSTKRKKNGEKSDYQEFLMHYINLASIKINELERESFNHKEQCDKEMAELEKSNYYNLFISLDSICTKEQKKKMLGIFKGKLENILMSSISNNENKVVQIPVNESKKSISEEYNTIISYTPDKTSWRHFLSDNLGMCE
jgi:hypothetical protein